MTSRLVDPRALPLFALVLALLLACPRLTSSQASQPLRAAAAGGGDVCSSAPARARFNDSQRLLLEQECAVLRAVNGLDAAALGRLLADDFSLVTVNGRTIPGARAEMIARWTAAPPAGERDESRLLEVSRVEVNGDSGYVVGTIEDRNVKTAISARGAEVTCQLHAFTDLWQRRGNAWTWVHAHESGLAPAPCSPMR